MNYDRLQALPDFTVRLINCLSKLVVPLSNIEMHATGKIEESSEEVAINPETKHNISNR